MNQKRIIERLNKPIDFDRVKKDFIEIWGAMTDLGLDEIDYIKLSDISDLSADNEVHLALILIGVARVFSENLGPCPLDNEEYWEAACSFLAGMPLSKKERKHYSVRITSEDTAS